MNEELGGSSRLLDFDVAVIEMLETFPPQFILRVEGVAPHADMTVELRPVPDRVRGRMRVEVVGVLKRPSRRRPAPYVSRLDLVAEVFGRRGVEVVGESRIERFDVGEETDVVEAVEVLDVIEIERYPDVIEESSGSGTPTGAAGSVRGVVCDDSGWALADTRVLVHPAHRGPQDGDPVGRTDAGGRFRHTVRGIGQVRVVAWAEGHHESAGETWVGTGRPGRVDLFLTPVTGTDAVRGPDDGASVDVVEGDG